MQAAAARGRRRGRARRRSARAQLAALARAAVVGGAACSRIRAQHGAAGRPPCPSRATGSVGAGVDSTSACGRASTAVVTGPAPAGRRPASSTSMITISGAASTIARSTAELQRDRRRRAAVAAAEQPQVHRADVVVDVEQLDVAAVAGEERPHRLERRLDPRRSRSDRGAARARPAGWRPARRRRAGRAARATPRRASVDDPRRARRRRARSRRRRSSSTAPYARGSAAACSSSSSRSIRSPTSRRSCAAVVHPAVGSTGQRRGRRPGSASAPSAAPCPCRGTCARRTAGTGRSCARPA